MILKYTKYFEKWFNKLTVEIYKVVVSNINKLAKENFSNCKSVGDNVHELKIHYGKGIRVYFTNINGQIILLLCGGDKSSQQKDITKAKEICKEVQNEIKNYK